MCVRVCLARYDQQLGGCVCVCVCVWLDTISSWEGVCVCVCGCVWLDTISSWEGVWVCLARYDQQLGGCVCVCVCVCEGVSG